MQEPFQRIWHRVFERRGCSVEEHKPVPQPPLATGRNVRVDSACRTRNGLLAISADKDRSLFGGALASGHRQATVATSQQLVFVAKDFFAKPELIRRAFEKCCLTSTEGLSEIRYPFVPGVGTHLSVPADTFEKALLADFITRVRTWSARELGATHVSTPSVSAFVVGCRRAVVRDDIPTLWHYMFSLSAEAAVRRDSGFEVADVLARRRWPS